MNKLKASFKKHRKLWIGLAVLILLALLFWFYTYFFSKDHKKVIYQDAQRRIYLIERKQYDKGKDREMWRMVFENQKDGNRFFILGNAPKGYAEKKMARIVINTIDQGKTKSFDQVERVGVTMKLAKTDIHSNLIGKKDVADLFPAMDENLITI